MCPYLANKGMNNKLELWEKELRVLCMFLGPDRQHLDAFLNDMVPVLVVHTLEHVAFEFRHQGDETLHPNDFQGLLDHAAAVPAKGGREGEE